ncbi:hypothetical protein [Rufibacter ruber]|uniref:hypothetical protein n=1 Tax=Rufibacter ruber TaxID=1783499 RepID=UPI00137B1DBD|nr:hypothetical protein [Rufibacter ruber]
MQGMNHFRLRPNTTAVDLGGLLSGSPTARRCKLSVFGLFSQKQAKNGFPFSKAKMG